MCITATINHLFIHRFGCHDTSDDITGILSLPTWISHIFPKISKWLMTCVDRTNSKWYWHGKIYYFCSDQNGASAKLNLHIQLSCLWHCKTLEENSGQWKAPWRTNALLYIESFRSKNKCPLHAERVVIFFSLRAKWNRCFQGQDISAREINTTNILFLFSLSSAVVQVPQIPLSNM